MSTCRRVSPRPRAASRRRSALGVVVDWRCTHRHHEVRPRHVEEAVRGHHLGQRPAEARLPDQGLLAHVWRRERRAPPRPRRPQLRAGDPVQALRRVPGEDLDPLVLAHLQLALRDDADEEAPLGLVGCELRLHRRAEVVVDHRRRRVGVPRPAAERLPGIRRRRRRPLPRGLAPAGAAAQPQPGRHGLGAPPGGRALSGGENGGQVHARQRPQRRCGRRAGRARGGGRSGRGPGGLEARPSPGLRHRPVPVDLAPPSAGGGGPRLRRRG